MLPRLTALPCPALPCPARSNSHTRPTAPAPAAVAARLCLLTANLAAARGESESACMDAQERAEGASLSPMPMPVPMPMPASERQPPRPLARRHRGRIPSHSLAHKICFQIRAAPDPLYYSNVPATQIVLYYCNYIVRQALANKAPHRIHAFYWIYAHDATHPTLPQ